MHVNFDCESVGLVCGIEIHQQLDSSTKLFCGCPTRQREVEESNFEFFRYLRPARSELGEIDRAALEEVLIRRRFIYKSYDSTCLVEADEEPPSVLNCEALEIALIIAKLLHMQIVDEVQTMRKIVIDGSNTTGFQRTAFIASSGHIETSSGRVGIDILCLEEEAARIIEDIGDEVVYSLDRLGIPLVEIGTAPDIASPQHAREVAQHLGMILRSTGRVKRGLGTIRQDVNVSIAGGARVEIKGVQDLNLVERIVEMEAERQLRLLDIQSLLVKRGAHIAGTTVDVTHIFAETDSRVIGNAIKKGGVVLASKLVGFAGIVGAEIQPGRRLGSELSDHAKRAGLGGIFHTDELPAYGIRDEDKRAVMQTLSASDDDCVVLVTGPRDRAESAIKGVLARANGALIGVPEETRRALPDGTSEYMRPLPGSARMYPETDVPPVEITDELIEGLGLPETFDQRAARYEREHGLHRELSRLIASSPNYQLFEEIIQRCPASPALVVRTLEATPRELVKEGVQVANLTDHHYMDCFEMLSKDSIAKEGLPDLLRVLAKNPDMEASEAARLAGLYGVDTDSVSIIVKEVVASKEEFVRDKKDRALGPLMGIVMKELRGRADGAKVASLLKEEIERVLKK